MRQFCMTQPEEWMRAFHKQSKRDGYDAVSAWIGDCLMKHVDADLKRKLKSRRRRGRPPKEKSA